MHSMIKLCRIILWSNDYVSIEIGHVNTRQGGQPCQVFLMTGIHSRAEQD